MNARWYLRRLSRMSAGEVYARAADAGRQRLWSRRAARPLPLPPLGAGLRVPTAGLLRAQAPTGAAARAVVAAADKLLHGEWPLFHLRLTNVAEEPDWFRDPLTGTIAPRTGVGFFVPYRDEAACGNIKFVWELSRHQATTLLACAWWLTGRDAYAERVAQHLRSWWRDNPFLTGVHWASGIELGLRLLSWTWIATLLAEWEGAPALFGQNDVFVGQLHAHQRTLAAFQSHGSSANNHLIAELAGQSAAATAFPWFRESAGWAAQARRGLVRAAAAQTHADGFNREQASDYHLFVFELLLAAALPARLAGQPFPAELDDTLRRMADALAASLDSAGRPPRFGDGDDGRGLLVDAPGAPAAAGVLDASRALYGAAAWWPRPAGSVLGHVAALVAAEASQERSVARPALFADAGVAILRSGEGADEIWLRCDSGPHGYLSIAAHGHADALAVELRCGGVQVLADPGTYCYHGEPEWRALFRGTPGHSTLTVDGQDQGETGGPFLWLNSPRSTLRWFDAADGVQTWQASHDGYRRLADPVTHHRRVGLDEARRTVAITDWIDAAEAHAVMLAYHLHPDVSVTLQGHSAILRWAGGEAVAVLPPSLQWSVHRGETAPPFGWYSPGFGHRVPAAVLAGRGMLPPALRLQSYFTVKRS